MKSSIKSLAAVVAVFVGTTGAAFATVNVPEPGSLALVGLAVAIGVAVSLRKKK